MHVNSLTGAKKNRGQACGSRSSDGHIHGCQLGKGEGGARVLGVCYKWTHLISGCVMTLVQLAFQCQELIVFVQRR